MSRDAFCRVYWGSHGCALPRGHVGDHICGCAWKDTQPGVANVGAPPYYGAGTHFYGEDAEALGLPLVGGE